MRKLFLGFLFSISFLSFATAFDIKPYVSLKTSAVSMQTDADQWVLDGVVRSTIVDKTLKDTVFGLRAAAGFGLDVSSLRGALRFEAEYGYNGKTEHTGTYNHSNVIPTAYFLKTTVQSLFANVYYDFNAGAGFFPYIGGGIGYAKIKEEGGLNNQFASFTNTDHDNNFAWNLGVGLGYKINENFIADLGYHYANYGKRNDVITQATITSTSNYAFFSHECSLGLRFIF